MPDDASKGYMGLMPRRVLEPLLRENSLFLQDSQSQRHVDGLNRRDAQSLATEYEVLLLNALSKVGEVVHEPDLGGSSRPDIFFRSAESGVSFVADITCVSDADAYRVNAVEELQEQFRKLLPKHGVRPGGFSFRIDGQVIGPPGKRKTRLSLPPRPEIPRLIEDLTGFVRTVGMAPGSPHATTISRPGASLTVSYDPRNRFGMMVSHLSFTYPLSLRNNPLANRLHDKAKQLRDTGFTGPAGVIVCDGYCTSLNDEGLSATAHFTGRQIVTDFFRRHTSVSFVALFRVHAPHSTTKRITPSFEMRVFRNPKSPHSLPAAAEDLLKSLPSVLPAPDATPVNALHDYAAEPSHKGRSFYGGYQITGRYQMAEVRISARSVLELLAGSLDLQDFLRSLRMAPSDLHPNATNFFRYHLDAGHLLTGARVEREPQQDDDWLVLTMGGPDPAVTAFRLDRETSRIGPSGNVDSGSPAADS